MILTITLLVIGHLHLTQPTFVAMLHQTQGYTVQLQQPVVNGIKLQPAHPTIVTTWSQ